MSKDDILDNAADGSQIAGGAPEDAAEEIVEENGADDATAYADAAAPFSSDGTYAEYKPLRPVARRVPRQPLNEVPEYDEDDVIDSPFFEQQSLRLQEQSALDARNQGVDEPASNAYDDGMPDADFEVVAAPGATGEAEVVEIIEDGVAEPPASSGFDAGFDGETDEAAPGPVNADTFGTIDSDVLTIAGAKAVATGVNTSASTEKEALLKEVADILEDTAADEAVYDEAADGGIAGDEYGDTGEGDAGEESTGEGDAGDGDESAEDESGEKKPKRFSLGVFIGCVVAALAVGLAVGTFVIGVGPGGSAVTGKIVVSEADLNSPAATFSSGGRAGNITVREVIEQTSSLAAAMGQDGSYAVPSADSVLSVARNKIVVADAENRGITATDEEIAAYAEAQLGTSDFAEIAKNYSMEERSAAAVLRDSCLMSKLRDEVLGEQGSASVEMPASPPEPGTTTEVDPETGEERIVDASGIATKEYADYIIALAGDEWDAEKGTWASEDGPYAKALAGYGVTPDGATYEAAATAYYVAFQAYTDASAAVSAVWNDYVNNLLAKSTIIIYTMLT